MALNNVYVLVMFGIVTAGVTLFESTSGGWLSSAYRAVHGLLWTTLRLGRPRCADRPADGFLGDTCQGIGRSDDSLHRRSAPCGGHLSMAWTLVTGIVLAAVVILEVVGPLLTGRALLVTGEAQTIPSPMQEVVDAEATM